MYRLLFIVIINIYDSKILFINYLCEFKSDYLCLIIIKLYVYIIVLLFS